MPKPRALGNVGTALVGAISDRLAANQRNFFEAVIRIYEGDKEAAVQALKPIADNNALALQVLTLMRAGDMQSAQDLLIDAGVKEKPQLPDRT